MSLYLSRMKCIVARYTVGLNMSTQAYQLDYCRYVNYFTLLVIS